MWLDLLGGDAGGVAARESVPDLQMGVYSV